MDKYSGEPTTVGASTEAIAQALEAAGVDPVAVMRAADVDRVRSIDPLLRISDSSVNAIYARAVEATGNPYFGLNVADAVMPGMLHALGYALLASETLEDFTNRLSRYYSLVSQSGQITTIASADELCLEARPRNPALCFETQDAWAALVIRLMRAVYHGDFSPRLLELRRPVPAQGSGPFEEYFHCPVRFDCATLRFHFDAGQMREPLLGANRELAQHNDHVVIAYLEKLDRDDISNRVRTHLIGLLSAGECGRAQIAARMHMSPSTLQVKLARQGTSFLEVLDSTRRELALGYIGQSRLSITGMAFMLGFSDVSNFNRAFRRWTGMSPSEYRSATS